MYLKNKLIDADKTKENKRKQKERKNHVIDHFK